MWPLPRSYSAGSQSLTISSSFSFTSNISSPIIDAAVQRYTPIIFPESTHSSTRKIQVNSLTGLQFLIGSSSEDLNLETDESYQLIVDGTSMSYIRANTVYGAMRGLETFSQLVRFDFDSASYVIDNAPWKIQDSPKYD